MAICKTNGGLAAAILIFTIISEVSQVNGGYYFGDKNRDKSLERCEEDLSCCRSKTVNNKRLEYELLTMTTCKTRLEKEVEELKCALKKCKKHSKHFENQVICMTNTINDLKSQLNRKEKELEECRKKLGTIEDKYNEIIKNINVKYEDCKDEIVKILGELEDADDKYDECVNNKTILEIELEHCRNETGGLRTELLIAEIDLRNKTKLLKECENTVDNLVLSGSNCEARADAFAAALAECSANLTTVTYAFTQCDIRAEAEAEAAATCNGALANCTATASNFSKEIADIYKACEDKFASINQTKFIFVGKKTYYIVDTQNLNWHQAQSWCWDHGMVGLACPKSENEFNSIFATLESKNPAAGSSWYIGYTSAHQDSGTWWCDKIGTVPNGDIPFISNEPNNSGGVEDVLSVIHSNGLTWGINDRSATGTLNFVCEVDQDCVEILYFDND